MPAVRQVLLIPKGCTPVPGLALSDFPLNENVFDLVFDHYNNTGSTIATSPKLIEQALKVILPFDKAITIKLIGSPDLVDPNDNLTILKNSRTNNQVYLWSGGKWVSIYELLPRLDKLVTDKEKKLNLILSLPPAISVS